MGTQVIATRHFSIWSTESNFQFSYDHVDSSMSHVFRSNFWWEARKKPYLTSSSTPSWDIL